MLKHLLAFILLVVSSVAQAEAGGLVTSYPFTYPAYSIMNQPVTNYTATSWSSTAINEYVTNFPGTLSFNHNLFTPAFFTVNSNAPSETVYTQTITWGSHSISNVPVPASMITLASSRRASGDTDNSVCLYDTYAGIAYQFQGVTISGTTVSVTAAGAYYPATSSGWWNDVWPALTGGTGGPQIGRASGNEVCDGVIGLQELQSGTINHAIVFAWPVAYARGSSESPQYVYPATSSDGTGTHGVTLDVPEGARMVIDPAVTDATLMTTYGLPTSELPIIHAMQKYGAYLVDTDGSSAMAIQLMADGQSGSSTLYPVPVNIPVSLITAHAWFVNPPTPIAPLDNRLQNSPALFN